MPWPALLALAGCNLAPVALPLNDDQHQGAVLVISGGLAPSIVLTAPEEIAAALGSLPAAARATLLETGSFESSNSELIEAHLRVVLSQPSLRRRAPLLGPSDTTWGQIKDRYRSG